MPACNLSVEQFKNSEALGVYLHLSQAACHLSHAVSNSELDASPTIGQEKAYTLEQWKNKGRGLMLDFECSLL
jgi:hypothetical protein